MSRTVCKAIAAFVFAFISTHVLAEPGPFARESPAMSEVPNFTILGRTTVLEKSRPETVLDRSGVRHVISYDALGRVHAITQPDLHRVYVAEYDPVSGKLSALTLLDVSTGKALYRAQRKSHEKLLTDEDQVDHTEQIVVIGSYDNAQATDFWGGSGPDPSLFLRLDPGPLPTCSKSGCNAMCDKANNLALSLCALWGIAQPLAGGACVVAALIAYSGCSSHCDGDCQMP